MKQVILILLAAMAGVGMFACRFVNAKEPETLADDVAWERLLCKNDLPEFSSIAFSSNGERFIISDGYSFF